MAKVGRFVVDPKAGAYCQLTLDSGEKLIVNHDKGGFKGGPPPSRRPNGGGQGRGSSPAISTAGPAGQPW
jgi:hypothetical protein